MRLNFVRIGDLSDQIRGVSYGKEDASKIPQDGYLPVLRAGNITDNGLVFSDLVYVPKAKVSLKQKLKSGDIVIAASSGSLDVVGKAAPVLSDFDGSFGAFCKVMRPNEKVDAKFLAQFFKTPEYRKKISALAAGANINNLRNEHLDELLVPLFPLSEQRRIAAIAARASPSPSTDGKCAANCRVKRPLPQPMSTMGSDVSACASSTGRYCDISSRSPASHSTSPPTPVAPMPDQ